MVMEFPQEMTGYQRLLAHRISQHYGLQTSSVPGVRSQSRVVARRCAQTRIPKVKITELKNVHCPPEATKAAPEVTIKRRLGGAACRPSAPHAGDGSGPTSSQVRTVKEREQEYKAARDRILGESSESGRGGGSVAGQKENVVDKGQKAADDPKSKAVFRNREKEMQDPDYRRRPSRFQRGFDPNGANYFDRQNAQGMYNVRSYNTEFPVLSGARSAPTNVAAAPFYPPSMTQWPHHGGSVPSAPARTNSLGNHEQGGFQQSMSGPMTPGPQPYSMPAFTMPPHHYSMPRMHYAYPPDMMAGPSPPGAMYPPPAGSQHMPFRPVGMGQYRGMPGYMIPSMPGQEGMGMVPSMPYPMYGAYPNHPMGYPDYGDMHGYHGQHMVNGFAMAGHHDASSAAGGGEHAGRGAGGGGGGCSSPRADAGSVAPKVENTSKPQAVEN
ncbi:unnamed protein product [Ostreobium quekettii]|uniref:SUZ domain-containing protein n=1 Tax=Ostreobium quekettii TaxID=121088 RepID=A0A8S1IMM9_9CHLO|nr:unnamed protein product [Ostreobium quekettii]